MVIWATSALKDYPEGTTCRGGRVGKELAAAMLEEVLVLRVDDIVGFPKPLWNSLKKEMKQKPFRQAQHFINNRATDSHEIVDWLEGIKKGTFTEEDMFRVY